MAQVHFSAGLRDLTGGLAQVEVEATTVRRLVVALEEMFPGIGEHLNAAAAVALYMIFVLGLLALLARRITGMQEIRGTKISQHRSLYDRLLNVRALALTLLNPTRKEKHWFGK